jgi:hypothetical protein
MPDMHWSNQLPGWLTFDENGETTVSFKVSNRTQGGMMMVASRIAALMDAFGETGDDDHDPLADEEIDDLARLLDHTHRVVNCLVAQEDRVMKVLSSKGYGSRRMATSMECSHQTVLNRLARIEAAEAKGLNSAGFVDSEPEQAVSVDVFGILDPPESPSR